MKKLITSIFVLSFVLAISCKFQVPQKISVKTNAEYKLNVGSIKKDLSETINLDDLLSEDLVKQVIPNARVYDYFPGEKDSKVQQYLLKLPLVEMPVDMGQYFDNSDISLAVQDMSFEQEITIPSIKIEEKQDIDVDFVNDMLNTAFSFVGRVGSGTATFAADFGSIEYKNLTLNIKVSGEIPDGTLLTVSNGNSSATSTFFGNEAQVNLGEFSFTKNNLTIDFSYMDTNLSYVGTISSDSKIKKATGVTYPTIDVTDPVEFPVQVTIPVPNSFVNAKIAEGSLTTQINLPWENTSIKYGINTSGALTIKDKVTTNPNKNISLNNKVISSGDINVEAPVTLTFNDATIDFEQNPTISIKTEIKRFNEVTIKADGVNTSLEQIDDFPSDVYETVKEIKLNPSGILGKYTNTLPEGNDISVETNSIFFGITDKSVSLKGGLDNIDKDFEPIMGTETKTIKVVPPTNHNVANGEYGKWDFNIKMKLPGATEENPDYITIKNVVPGSTYKIGLTVTPQLNWEHVVIQPPTSLNRSEVQSLGINFSSLFDGISDSMGIDNFAEKIQLKSIPVYIRAEKPGLGDTFSGLNFGTKVSLFFGKENEGIVEKVKDTNGKELSIDLIGATGNLENLNFVKDTINYEMKDNYLITDVSKAENSVNSDLAGLLNSSFNLTDGELYIDYEVEIGGSGGNGITIHKTDLNEDTSSSISVVALIVVPIQFEVVTENPLTIDFNSILGTSTDSDLFGRSGPEAVGGDSISDFTQAIESCGIEYTSKALPFYADPSIEIKVKMTPSSEEKTFKVSGDTMMISRDEVNEILGPSSYPFGPDKMKIAISIPGKALFSLQRELALDLNVALMLNTDGSIDVMGGK